MLQKSTIQKLKKWWNGYSNFTSGGNASVLYIEKGMKKKLQKHWNNHWKFYIGTFLTSIGLIVAYLSLIKQ